jgi:hypothetical protein
LRPASAPEQARDRQTGRTQSADRKPDQFVVVQVRQTLQQAGAIGA